MRTCNVTWMEDWMAIWLSTVCLSSRKPRAMAAAWAASPAFSTRPVSSNPLFSDCTLMRVPGIMRAIAA